MTPIAALDLLDRFGNVWPLQTRSILARLVIHGLQQWSKVLLLPGISEFLLER